MNETKPEEKGRDIHSPVRVLFGTKTIPQSQRHLTDSWFKVAVSIADQATRSPRRGLVSGDTQQKLDLRLKKYEKIMKNSKRVRIAKLA